MSAKKNKDYEVDNDVITVDIQPFLTPIAIILGSLIISISLLIGLNGVKSDSSSTGNNTKTTPTPTTTAEVKADINTVKGLYTSNNIAFGDSERSVLFVEVSDPSCPYCHIAGGENPELSKQAGSFQYDTDGGTYKPPVREMRKLVEEGKASYVWLYANGHGNGELGAQAFYCAQEQGKFWEVHDLLMSNAGYSLLNETVKNDTSKIGTLVDFLKNVVDTNSMQSCLESGKYASRLTQDEATATTLGLIGCSTCGTPGFLVNTTPFHGAYSFDEMQDAINETLQ